MVSSKYILSLPYRHVPNAMWVEKKPALYHFLLFYYNIMEILCVVNVPLNCVINNSASENGVSLNCLKTLLLEFNLVN